MSNAGLPPRRIAAYDLRPTTQARPPRRRTVRTGPPPLSLLHARLIALLVLASGGLAAAGIFFPYTVGAVPSSHHLSQIVLHGVPAGLWLLGGLVMFGPSGAAVRCGNALAAGATLVTTGLTIVTASELIPGDASLGLAFWLEVGANALALVAAVIAFLVLRRASGAGGFGGLRPVALAVTVLVGGAVVVGYVPDWVAVTVRYDKGSTHQRETLPLNSHFAASWEIVVGHVVVLLGLAVVPVIASQWERLRPAGSLMAGAALAVVAYLAEPVIEIIKPLGQFTAAERKKLAGAGLTYSVHLRGWWWVLAAGAAALLVLGLIQLLRPGPDPDDLTVR